MGDDPFSAKNLVATAYMAAIAGVSGAVSFYQKVKAGKARPFNVPEFAGEIIISGTVGVMTFWFFKGMGINEYLTAAGVAVSGHMGARAIFLAETKVEEFFKTWTPKN